MKTKSKEPEEEGEPCSVANDDCLAPAGWKNGSGIIENHGARAAFTCYECGEPVCSRCSVPVVKAKRSERRCLSCKESEEHARRRRPKQ